MSKWAAILVATAAIGAAQQVDEIRVSARAYTPPQHRIATQASLVQLEVVVRDSQGRPVSGMRPEDFTIVDAGVPRTIAGFSVETRAVLTPPGRGPKLAVDAVVPPPRSTLLFFDDLHSNPAEMQRMQTVATRFFKGGLGPGARAAIFTATQGLMLDFTGDVVALTAAIQKLRAHPHLSEAGLQPCPRITPYTAYMIDHMQDLSALTASVREFESCLAVSQDVTAQTPSGGGKSKQLAPVDRSPNLGTDPHAMAKSAVYGQASATMQQVRDDSLAAFDAIDNSLTLLARTPGTRVLVMVSEGFISGMLDRDRDRLIDRAVHSAITINALDAKGLWSEAPSRPFAQVQQTLGALPSDTYVYEETSGGARDAEFNGVMYSLTAGTGGLFFHNGNDLAQGLAQVVAVPETAYLIAFHPDTAAAGGQYRKVKVSLTEKNGRYVQSRPGYVSPAAAAASGTQEPRAIDHEVLVSDVLTQIPLQLAGHLGKGEANDPSISLVMHVGLGQLKFADREDRHVQKLVFIGELVDVNGHMIAAKEGAMELSLKDDTLARLRVNGVNATLGLNAPPGGYMVRVVVQDADGKMAARNETVMIGK